MDVIYECATKFATLTNYTYHFVVSQNRKSRDLILNFQASDFFHLAGLHYLTDISIPQNRHNVLTNIIEKKKINDDLLYKSRFFNNPKPDRDIKSRIDKLRFIEEYLDTNNIIRIYNTKNDKYLQSLIKADYLIESQLENSTDIVYIFLKERAGSPNYLCVVSFFKKDTISYGGDKLYWLLKEKITPYGKIVLFQHPNYQTV